jgi:hypothetical protein
MNASKRRKFLLASLIIVNGTGETVGSALANHPDRLAMQGARLSVPES